ncbi:insulinase family protein [Microvirga tunisiensis]|uniref:Insulinase family protein n=2 Tax=Pannonibacter tanglangensis TaxID=2750084 RepID=A0ABW9ZLK5_9HYPH|nr:MULTISPECIES: pitrilysin family protein [unclassified Pannonibacter]NBN64476.1 insulinase family protein [Pannonibacter sp. XCT-34]NBN79008.1 insulinase family protein [Pannonibacter sp. XCT-53]
MFHSLDFVKRSAAATVIGSSLLLASPWPALATTIERVISPGGIEAWLVEDQTLPIIAVNFAFDNGSAQDPAGKEGVTNLMAASLNEGAGDMDAAAYQARMEELAISVGFSAGGDQTFGSLRTLANTRDEAFEMLRLAVNEPRFDADAVERMRSQILVGLKQAEEDPDAVASRAFMEAAFPGHPYSRPTDGTIASVTALTPADLEAQRARLFTREGLVIGVVGAIDARTLAPLLDSVFGKLAEKSTLPAIPDVVARTGERISRTMDVPQTTILLGLPALKRDDKDYQAAFVMDHILGGGSFTSWLYEEVREKRGLSYGVGTDLSPSAHTGLLFASAATRADKANETLEIILAQFRRMAEEGPSAEELAKAKAFLTGSYALRFDTSGKIASQLVALQTARLGIDYFDRRNAEIEAVTLEDVRRVAKRLLENQTPLVVTVGPAAS